MKVTTTKDSYRNYFYAFGMLTVLYLLEHFEQKENFEECAKIIDAIKDEEKRIGTTFYTKITKDCINDIIGAYQRFGLTGKNLYEDSEYYKNQILELIE